MKPDRICNIIMACAVLHNVALLMNEPDVVDERQIPIDMDEQYNGAQDGRRIRFYHTNIFCSLNTMIFVFHCFVNLKSLGQFESKLGTKDLWLSHFKIYSTVHPTSKIPTITLKHTLG